MFGDETYYQMCLPAHHVFNFSTEISRWRLELWRLKMILKKSSYMGVKSMVRSMPGYDVYVFKMFIYDRQVKGKWMVRVPPIGKRIFYKMIRSYPYL